MVKRLKLKDHLPLAEVERAYRGATGPVARGEATAAVAAIAGRSPS